MRSNSGPEIRAWYSWAHLGARPQARPASSRWPQRHCCVAFLPFGPISLRSLRVPPFVREPKTLGEHLRRRRVLLGLHQWQAAEMLATTAWTYRNWENGKTTSGAVAYRGIVEFLGYHPHPSPQTLGERLLKLRRCRGLTSRAVAELMKVDQGTFLMWERGKWKPTGRRKADLQRLLDQETQHEADQ
jgi:transcriptional regulator with XRE-family HTH domain